MILTVNGLPKLWHPKLNTISWITRGSTIFNCTLSSAWSISQLFYQQVFSKHPSPPGAMLSKITTLLSVAYHHTSFSAKSDSHLIQIFKIQALFQMNCQDTYTTYFCTSRNVNKFKAGEKILVTTYMHSFSSL